MRGFSGSRLSTNVENRRLSLAFEFHGTAYELELLMKLGAWVNYTSGKC